MGAFDVDFVVGTFDFLDCYLGVCFCHRGIGKDKSNFKVKTTVDTSTIIPRQARQRFQIRPTNCIFRMMRLHVGQSFELTTGNLEQAFWRIEFIQPSNWKKKRKTDEKIEKTKNWKSQYFDSGVWHFGFYEFGLDYHHFIFFVGVEVVCEGFQKSKIS